MATTPLHSSQHPLPAPGVGRRVPLPPTALPHAAASTPPRPTTTDPLTDALAAVRTLLQAGRADEACQQLHALTRTHPTAAEPWLQLLALEPTPAEEIDLIERFLQHHPTHRFAAAMRARLEHTRIVVLLGAPATPTQPGAATPTTTVYLGEYLVQQGWVTPAQVEQALAEQRRLRELGLQQRLGAILLMGGQLQPHQLAVALADVSGAGFGEFGDYLVREGVLTAAQVGQALAQQAAIAARIDREYLVALTAHQKGGLGRLLGKTREMPRRQPVPKLGEVMVRMGLLTPEQVEMALRERKRLFDASFE